MRLNDGIVMYVIRQKTRSFKNISNLIYSKTHEHKKFLFLLLKKLNDLNQKLMK